MKKKVMFVIPSLHGGGAEKVLLDIVSNLSPEKYHICIVLFEKKGILLEKVPYYVELIDLRKKNKYSVPALIIRLAKTIRISRPDNLISFMHYSNVISVLAVNLSGIKTNLILTIHTHLSISLLNTSFAKLRIYLSKKLFKHADHIVMPSNGIQKMLIKDFNLTDSKKHIIPHPLLLDVICQKANEPINDIFNYKYILMVGRLTEAKGIPVFLKSYKKICGRVKEKALILGTGEEEIHLKKLTKELGIEKRVVFAGFQNNPYKFMKNASIFVLSSLWESFAIVIAEAMACGVPIVSTDCPSGPGELIISGENGLLVPPQDEQALASAMLKLINDKQLQHKFIQNGLKQAATLRVEKIIPKYEKILE